MKRLKENKMLDVEIGINGEVVVEGQPVGRLEGFRFTPETIASTQEGKAMRAAAQKALSGEIETRANKLSQAPDGEIVLGSDGVIRWLGQTVARLQNGEDALSPGVNILADEHMPGPNLEMVETRLSLWLTTHIETLLRPLIELKNASDLTGIARGLAFQIAENLGNIPRRQVLKDVRGLDQDTRAIMRRYGVRFGAFHIFVPALLKPAASGLLATLWATKNDQENAAGVAEIPQLSASGRTSIATDERFEKALYQVCGFYLTGSRAVRIDILERLADMIRPLVGWRADGQSERPDGVVDGGGFSVTVDMTSLLGCAGEEFSSILTSLGYRVERRAMTEDERTAYLAKKPQPPAETIAPDAEPDAPVPDSAATVEAATVIEPTETAAAETAEVAIDAAPTDPAPSPGEDSNQPATEAVDEFMIDVWRQQPLQRERPAGNKRSDKSRTPQNRAPSKGKNRPQHDKPGQQNQHKKAPKPKREVPIDPDSPFAKLLELKNQLERKS
jgi:ATP-dependent RNA helicase SUPV3L1/SUV3